MRPCVPDLPSSLVRALGDRGRGLTLLVVRLGAMGDILRTVPAVRLLRAALPEARILWAVEQRWSVVLDGHPDLDGLIAAPRKRWDRMLRSPLRWAALLTSLRDFRGRLRAERPQLAVDFHGNLRSGLTVWLSGATVRLGHAGHQQKEGNRLFTTHRVAPGDRRTPRPERNLALLGALGIPTSPIGECRLPLAAAGREEARRIAASLGLAERRYAVVVPGASRRQAYKKPPVDLLAAGCRALAGRGIASLVVHGPGEEQDARAVVRSAGSAARLAPPTGLPALAGLLADARLYIGGDTGPLHLACAVGCPVIALYGPTDPRVNRPWGVEYRVVHPAGRRYTGIKRRDRAAGGFECLGTIDVERAVAEMLPDATPVS